MPSPLDQLREVCQAVRVPVQAVGELSLEQAIECPKYGAPLVGLGAPLTIDADAFKTADGGKRPWESVQCSQTSLNG
ncbi:MAG: 3-hexulose-6-phosphate synthase, partial [Mariniblastus sp.]